VPEFPNVIKMAAYLTVMLLIDLVDSFCRNRAETCRNERVNEYGRCWRGLQFSNKSVGSWRPSRSVCSSDWAS